MVNSEHAGVRAAGRHLLESLAEQFPEDYAGLVREILTLAKVGADDEHADDAG